MRWPCLTALAFVACDDPSFVVQVHRSAASNHVAVEACDGGCSVDPFAGAPDAVTRSIGFFVHSAPQTLLLEWSVQSTGGSRCDAFTVPFKGDPLAFDVTLFPSAALSVTGCGVCGAPRPCNRGPGSDGGDDGGSDGGTDGGPDGGTDGGSTVVSDGGRIQWDPINVPFPLKDITAVRALSGERIWVAAVNMADEAVILGGDGGSWVVVNFGGGGGIITDLDLIPSTLRIAAAHDAQVLECNAGATSCRDAGDWVSVTVNSGYVHGLCSDAQTSYAVGRDTIGSGFGLLLANDQGTYVGKAGFSNTGHLIDCAVQADGTVVVVGVGYVGRYFPDGGGSDELPVQNAMFNGTTTTWSAIISVGGRTFLAGDDQQVVEMLGDGGFLRHFAPTGMGLPRLLAIGGLPTSELFAVGEEPTDVAAVRFDGAVWDAFPSLQLGLTVESITAVDANTWFAGGQATSAGVLLFGHR